MALHINKIKNAEPREKEYKLADGNGLYLLVKPNGSKLWRYKFAFQGKEQLLSIGAYPFVSLKDARERHAEARKLLAQGTNPCVEKKKRAIKARLASGDTFEAIAAEFLTKREKEGMAAATLSKSKWALGLIASAIGRLPITEIEPQELLVALREIEAKGHYDSAKRVRSLADRVFRYAIITGRAQHNPAAHLGGALVTHKVRHRAAILDKRKLGRLMRDIEAYNGSPYTILALKLSAHVFARPGEIRQMEWSEIDFQNAKWTIPSWKMKSRKQHIVPLSSQSIEILKQAHEMNRKSPYVFHASGNWNNPMSENTVNQALRRMGYTKQEMTAHGFRSTASTLLNESGLWSPDAIEHSLAHTHKDSVRSAYNRGTNWDERVRLASWWSTLLDELRDTSDDDGEKVAAE